MTNTDTISNFRSSIYCKYVCSKIILVNSLSTEDRLKMCCGGIVVIKEPIQRR